MRHLLIITLLFLVGCPTPAPVVEPDDEPVEWGGGDKSPKSDKSISVVGQPVAVAPQFEGGCTPLGDTEELVGVVTMMDFGKGRRGVIIDDGTNKWVVSYNDENVFADFEKDRVLARGRQCENQGDAIRAYHFDVQSLRLVQ